MIIYHVEKPVLIAQHQPVASPGTLLEALVNAGVQVEVRQLYAGGALPDAEELQRLSGLIVLGGSMNVDQESDYPFIAEEQRLLLTALQRDVPVLGICLGAQQLAAAIGGRVYQRAAPEVGWVEVEVVRDDLLFEGLPRRFRALEWHAQSFVVPESAAVIAVRGDDPGVQAFRVGPRAWGVQFHPEIDESVIDHWISRDNKGMRDRDPGVLEALSRDRDEIVASSRALCAHLVGNWLASF